MFLWNYRQNLEFGYAFINWIINWIKMEYIVCSISNCLSSHSKGISENFIFGEASQVLLFQNQSQSSLAKFNCIDNPFSLYLEWCCNLAKSEADYVPFWTCFKLTMYIFLYKRSPLLRGVIVLAIRGKHSIFVSIHSKTEPAQTIHYPLGETDQDNLSFHLG